MEGGGDPVAGLGPEYKKSGKAPKGKREVFTGVLGDHAPVVRDISHGHLMRCIASWIPYACAKFVCHHANMPEPRITGVLSRFI